MEDKGCGPEMEEAPLHVTDAEISARVCGPEMEEAPLHVIDGEISPRVYHRAQRYIVVASRPHRRVEGRLQYITLPYPNKGYLVTLAVQTSLSTHSAFGVTTLKPPRYKDYLHHERHR